MSSGLDPVNADVIDGLVERKTGVFYRRSKAFLHFHVDGDDFYADVRLDGATFERMKVTTKSEQRALLVTVRQALARLSSARS